MGERWEWHNERLNGIGDGTEDHCIGVFRAIDAPVYTYRHARAIKTDDPDHPWQFDGNEEAVLIVDTRLISGPACHERVREWVAEVHEYERG